MDFQPRILSNGSVCCSHADALCDACEAHFAQNSYAPPNPYEEPLKQLRTASPHLTPFEQQWREQRIDALVREYADNIATGGDRFETLDASDLSKYTPPNGYEIALQGAKR